VSVRREVLEALSLDQMVSFYQPKVSLSTGEIVGLEVLARWGHPTRGILTPGYFGAVFDDPDLAPALRKSLLRQVTADIHHWLSLGLDPGRVAFNLSLVEFSNPELANEILSALEHMQIPTRHFEVEVTETVLLGRDSDHVSTILKRFHENGVLIALDDFGTGYSSLTHLKQFPVGHVKVDQSFVRDLEQDTGDEAIVSAVTGLGRSLGFEVTAEGVETHGQAQRLREMGCDNAQGYLFAKPLDGSQVPTLLANWKGSAQGLFNKPR
jgi:EAL domain-containing protein (putative c-di-GMP-specific phosphodiesterase class I)